MTNTKELEFRRIVRERLSTIAPALMGVLGILIKYEYPSEVFAVAFEVCDDGFTSGFPARAFFMDRENNEYFLYVNGKAQYPSPVDPGLVSIDEVYSQNIEESFQDTTEPFEVWDVATEEFIAWFSDCWDKAGGRTFTRVATISAHDSAEEFDLVRKRWQAMSSNFLLP